MILWNVGDTSVGICRTCRARVATTFATRPVRMEETGVTVPDVLVDICDRCGTTVSIPQQSVPRLKAAREQRDAKLQGRVTRKLSDVLWLVADALGGQPRDVNGLLVRYYLVQIGNHALAARQIARLAHGALTNGRKTDRIEARVSSPILASALAAVKRAGVQSETELLQGIIGQAAADVLDNRSLKRRTELQRLAAVA